MTCDKMISSVALHLKIILSHKFDIIQAVWSSKRKRTPSGELIKHKSSLCAHGGQQTSNTYWESFSPVVQWSTLRTILTLSIIKGWKARSIDFVLACPQADIKANIVGMNESISLEGNQ